jgi:protein-L-isoaspartate(D-aspartate) O-methyltransferase
MTDHATARLNMVENQLRPNRVVEQRLLDAMGAVPRELFVPEAMRGVAYADENIPLGGGRFLVEPLALGKLLQSAAVAPGDAALVVGDATGYAAAVVARLAARTSLLLPPEAAPQVPAVERQLRELACGEVVVRAGDPAAGMPDRAPFDVVVLVGAVEGVPQALLDQLADRGRLVTVVEERRQGRVTVCLKVADAVGRTTPFDAALPPLPGLRAAAGFVF